VGREEIGNESEAVYSKEVVEIDLLAYSICPGAAVFSPPGGAHFLPWTPSAPVKRAAGEEEEEEDRGSVCRNWRLLDVLNVRKRKDVVGGINELAGNERSSINNGEASLFFYTHLGRRDCEAAARVNATMAAAADDGDGFKGAHVMHDALGARALARINCC